MLVLGFDLGLTKDAPTALAVLWMPPGHPPILRHTCRLIPHGTDWRDRVASLANSASMFIDQHRPALVGYEAAHGRLNLQTLRKLACLEGAMLVVCAQLGIPSRDVQPAEAKVALAGDGRADKATMIAAARQQFGVVLTSHEADAIGVALAAEALHRRAALVTRRSA